VWFRSVFLKTLRDYRVAILGWGIGMGLVVVSPMASVAALVTTPQAREQLISIAQTFTWNADAIAVDTIGGYATFKIGTFIFLIAIWPLLAGSRMLRTGARWTCCSPFPAPGCASRWKSWRRCGRRCWGWAS
jgi:ABC-2 type transport system permease protein